MLQVHKLLEALAIPESDRAPAALRACLEHLVGLITQKSTPHVWSMTSENADLLLNNLPAMAEPPLLLVYWLKQYVANGEPYATTVHRYRSPSLGRLNCVVILQIVACEKQALRTQILEILEDDSLTEVVIASVFADQAVCKSLQMDFPDSFRHLIRFVSLCTTDASNMTGLRNQISGVFGVPSPYLGLTFMPQHIAILLNK